MMAYLFNSEDLDLVESAREFCENEIKERCKEYDVSGEWPAELYQSAAELGYTSLEVPEEYGGPGLERLTAAAIMEEFAKADAGFATTIAAISVKAPFVITAVVSVICLVMIIAFKPAKVKAADDKYRAKAGKPLDDALVGRK